MKNKIYITTVLITLIANLCFAGGDSPKLVRANKYYDKYAYKDAIALYLDLAKQNIAIEEVTKKLAISYRKINDMKSAEEWYAKLMSMSNKTSEDIYYYAEALQENGHAAKSAEYFEMFSKMEPNDSRAKEWNTSKGYIEKLLKDNARFSINTLDINSENADFGPAFYGDKVIFASSRKWEFSSVHTHSWNDQPFLDIYTADKDASYKLSNITHFANTINTKFHEGPACFSADGNTIFFTRNNYYNKHKTKSTDGVIKLELYSATKNKEGIWSDTKPFAYNNAEYSIGHPALTPDGKRLYFSSDMSGTMGQSDIWYSDLQADGSWAKPVNCGKEINTEGKELFPFVSEKGMLFFASEGHVGLGGLDVFYTTFKNNVFSKPKNLGASLNSTRDDFAFIINKEETKGYFSSNRDGGKGDDDIYSFNMLKKFQVDYILNGTVVDKQSQEVLAGSKVVLLDANEKVIEETVADSKGAYSFIVEPEKNYTVTGAKEKYFDDKTTISTAGLNEDSPSKSCKIDLQKDLGFALYCLITDKKTKAPLSNVTVKLIDNTTKQELVNLITDDKGDFMKPLLDKKMTDKLSYTIVLSKPGYLNESVQFNYTIAKSGIINIHEQLDIAMDKLEIGGDLAKMIDIKPIYFDLNKFNIRKDAAVELEKIVKVMNEYPNMVVELGSHTDCRATIKYNETLSDKRAKASAAYIKAKITKGERIYGKGYGESKLKNGCACEGKVKSTCTELEHQENRRTEFIIIKLD